MRADEGQVGRHEDPMDGRIPRGRGTAVGAASVAVLGAVAAWLAAVAPADAHAPLISCFDNDDGTVTCEAGYSDGASAAGQVVRVREATTRLIEEAVFDQTGAYTFKKPAVPFLVEFYGDASHVAQFDGDDLNK